MDSFNRSSVSAEEVDSLLETLKKEGSQRRSNTRGLRIVVTCTIGVILATEIAEYLKGKPFDVTPVLIFSSLLFGSYACGLTPRLLKAVNRAVELPDKRFLGSLIEALDAGEPKLKDSLETACANLLAQVTHDDLGLLDDYQLEQLVKAIRISKNVFFCSAGIKAIGCIGTSHTLLSLEVLLNDPLIHADRRSKLEPAVRAASADLRIRLARERIELSIPMAAPQSSTQNDNPSVEGVCE